jgi:SAM-dependent methyltransferase
MTARERWDRRYAGQEMVWSTEPNALFASLVRSLEPGTALDVACGEGRNGIWLAEQGWRVTAVDFSSVGVARGREIADRRNVTLDWVVANVVDLPVASYDLVAILYLHTGAAERALWLPHLIHMVAPGGTLIYIGHHPRNISEGTGGPQDPTLLPDVQQIVALLDDFRIDRAEVHTRSVHQEKGHGGGDGPAFDTVVQAYRPARTGP